MKNYSDRRDKIVFRLENLVEKHNGKIQILIFVSASLLLVLANVNSVLIEPLILSILGLMLVDLAVSQIKDSSLHRKINEIGPVLRNLTNEVAVKEHDLTEFFNSAQKEIFISGISLSHIVNKYGKLIQNILRSGISLKIMLLDPDSVETNASYLHKKNCDENDKDEIRNRITQTIKHLKKFKESSCHTEEKLEIRFATMLPVSTLMYDYEKDDRVNVYSESKNLYIRAYLYSCDDVPDCEVFSPTCVVNSNISSDAYWAYVNSALKMWESATPINEKIHLNELFV